MFAETFKINKKKIKCTKVPQVQKKQFSMFQYKAFYNVLVKLVEVGTS